MLDKIISKIQADLKVVNLADKIIDWIPNLILALLYIVFFWILWKVMRKGTELIFKRANLDETIGGFLQEVLKYTVFILAMVSVLGVMGVNTLSLMTSLGVLGLTIGFAAKDTLSNLIAGIFIFWDRPFRTGDLVEIDGHYGKVQQITLRSTRIVTVDGKMIAFPNTNIVNNKVISYTNFPHLRLDVEVTIGVNEDIERSRKLLLEMIANDSSYMQSPPPSVVTKALNDYNIALVVRAWIDDERQHIAQRFALREAVFNTLRDAGVELPYETIQLQPVKVQKEGDLNA